jgi:hypothetical protein
MTTKHSPLPVLQKQADAMANLIMRAARGEKVDAKIMGRVKAARDAGHPLKVGVMMDDKTIILELAWDTIANTSEAGLSQYILKLMQERRDNA